MLILELHTKDMDQLYDYNCFMLETPFSGWDDLLDKIDDNHVYDNDEGEYGKESEPHITILFGLHGGVSFEKMKEITDKIDTPIEYDITGIGVFENEDYDVLKLNVESDTLEELHEKACEYPYTNEYDDYNPHITLAYLKRGEGQKYTKEFDSPKTKKSSTFSYSTTKGKKYYWD